MTEENKEQGIIDIQKNFTPDWWTFVLLGLFAVLIGAVAYAFTPYFVAFSGYLIGIAVIIYSIINIIQGITSREGAGASAALIILGILGIIIGFFIVTSLLSTWLLVTYLIAIWAFMNGFSNLVMAFSGKAGTGYKILLIFAGIISVLLGIYVMMYPLVGTIIIIQVFSIFSMVWGIFLVATGISLRGKTSEEIAERMNLIPEEIVAEEESTKESAPKAEANEESSEPDTKETEEKDTKEN
ncbi:hypothetical protein F1737_11315 [Methanoplanus sp. FWC-SCC4]|uniref:HdeD family acid-resistance protein n=2 Tax=Methanochimaera problematica TaxID=2609417 RepID=A0AA97I3H5_9EURY|nr:hypothetical protein F1737_11315 [Methanoplanus sp. FWC-SCC4]